MECNGQMLRYPHKMATAQEHERERKRSNTGVWTRLGFIVAQTTLTSRDLNRSNILTVAHPMALQVLFFQKYMFYL